jgi:transcriptional regulator with XRE-family HTH domain
MSMTPTREQIRENRIAAGLTQAQAAAKVFTTPNVWSQWERGLRRMHPAFWALFILTTQPPAQQG